MRIIYQWSVVVDSTCLLKVRFYIMDGELNFQLLLLLINKINKCLLSAYHLKENTYYKTVASPKHLLI